MDAVVAAFRCRGSRFRGFFWTSLAAFYYKASLCWAGPVMTVEIGPVMTHSNISLCLL